MGNAVGTFSKKVWNYFSGKKRNMALIYWSLLAPAITVLWPEGVPSEVAKGSTIFGLVLSYLGLGHAAVKKVSAGREVEVSETDETTEKAE